jgi:hypothetical protein
VFGHLVFGTHYGGFATKAVSPRGPAARRPQADLRGHEEKKAERESIGKINHSPSGRRILTNLHEGFLDAD